MNKNKAVTAFLDDLNHPFRNEIEALRILILGTNPELSENIKWNGPNYLFEEEDRITMRIHPPKQLQLIFHRGAKVKEQPKSKLIDDPDNVLDWKSNDRAVLAFTTLQDIESKKEVLRSIISRWIAQK